MTVTSRTNITSSRDGSNGAGVPARPPRRDEISKATVGVLKQGGPSKADLLVVDVGGGPVVVKDFAAKSWWARLLGRVQIAREYRAYRWLGPIPAVPKLVGRVDAHALAIEKVEGEILSPVVNVVHLGEELVPQIRSLVDALHAAGLVHLDLRGRENLIRRPDGRVVVLDLAGALWFRPGGLAHRIFFPVFRRIDEAAYLKWKAKLTPGRFDPEERAFLRWFDALRPLWIFNRKPPKTKKKG